MNLRPPEYRYDHLEELRESSCRLIGLVTVDRTPV